MVRFVCVLRVSYSPGRSVAIADVPVARLTGGNATFSDRLTLCCLASQLLHVGCHGTLHSGVVGSGLVEKEHSVVCFDHGLILQGHQT